MKTKKQIKQWLHRYHIKKYTINDDLTVDVDGFVKLFNKEMIEIPIQFGIVNEFFDIEYNNLKSLKGCPKVVNGDFACSDNPLSSLEYLPIIRGKLFCDKKFHNTSEYKRYLMLKALRK